MYAAPPRRFRLGRLISDRFVRLYALMVVLVLLACAVVLIAGAHQERPDQQLLAPFRWTHAHRMG